MFRLPSSRFPSIYIRLKNSNLTHVRNTSITIGEGNNTKHSKFRTYLKEAINIIYVRNKFTNNEENRKGKKFCFICSTAVIGFGVILFYFLNPNHEYISLCQNGENDKFYGNDLHNDYSGQERDEKFLIDEFSRSDEASLRNYQGFQKGLNYIDPQNIEGPSFGFLLKMLVFTFLCGVLLRKSGISVNKGSSQNWDSLFKGFGGPLNDVHVIVKSDVKFSDVHGCDDAKKEIMEFVDFLKNPSKFSKLGARMPTGAIIHGPPGTGKTLLAKALAGEAGVPFYSAAGSSFTEIFLGTGVRRIKSLFADARANAPSIIYIDEIESLGKRRGSTMRHVEEDITLNRLLFELDGVDSKSGVLVFGSTNQYSHLDPALLRPGRFDRQIYLPPPDIFGRKDLFSHFLGKIKIPVGKTNDFSEKLAQLTSGSTGADISNICNEAALYAGVNKSKVVEFDSFENAVERLRYGNLTGRKNSERDQLLAAVNEAGNIISSWHLKTISPIIKASIISRGTDSSRTDYMKEDLSLIPKQNMNEDLIRLLSGRVAEELIFGQGSTKSVKALLNATLIAYKQITCYGMDSSLGNVCFSSSVRKFSSASRRLPPFDLTEYSPDLGNKIDNKVSDIISDSYEKSKALLSSHLSSLKKIASELMRKETLNYQEIEKILGSRQASVNFDQKNNSKTAVL